MQIQSWFHPTRTSTVSILPIGHQWNHLQGILPMIVQMQSYRGTATIVMTHFSRNDPGQGDKAGELGHSPTGRCQDARQPRQLQWRRREGLPDHHQGPPYPQAIAWSSGCCHWEAADSAVAVATVRCSDVNMAGADATAATAARRPCAPEPGSATAAGPTWPLPRPRAPRPCAMLAPRP